MQDWQSKQFELMKDFINLFEKKETTENPSNEKSSLSEKDEIEILKKQMSDLKKELNKKK